MREQGSLSPPARLSSLNTQLPSGLPKLTLARRRIALLHSDPGQADALAQILRGQSAEVIVLGPDPERLDARASFDPDAVLVEESQFYGSCWKVVQSLWQQPRLRWTPLLLMPDARAEQEVRPSHDVQVLCHAVHNLCADWDEVATLAARGQELEASLSTLGPARTLRALLSVDRALLASFTTPSGRAQVELIQREVAGVRADLSDGGTLLGATALAWLLAETRGTVHVKPLARVTMFNVMAALDVASPTVSASSQPALEPRSERPSGHRAALEFESYEAHTSTGTSGIRPAVALQREDIPPRQPPAAREEDEDDSDSPTVRLSAAALANVIAGIHPACDREKPTVEISARPEEEPCAPPELDKVQEVHAGALPDLILLVPDDARPTDEVDIPEAAVVSDMPIDPPKSPVVSKPAATQARRSSASRLATVLRFSLLVAATSAWWVTLAPKNVTDQVAKQLAPARGLLEDARTELWSVAEVRQALFEMGAWIKEYGVTLVSEPVHRSPP